MLQCRGPPRGPGYVGPLYVTLSVLRWPGQESRLLRSPARTRSLALSKRALKGPVRGMPGLECWDRACPASLSLDRTLGALMALMVPRLRLSGTEPGPMSLEFEPQSFSLEIGFKDFSVGKGGLRSEFAPLQDKAGPWGPQVKADPSPPASHPTFPPLPPQDASLTLICSFSVLLCCVLFAMAVPPPQPLCAGPWVPACTQPCLLLPHLCPPCPLGPPLFPFSGFVFF